ncbi:insulinase family protein [Rufibacter quisquiliarum]|uniref:Putative Zn-dependent peptidase n=1 Tax=Rufibacter quisquiliarum TaxID=1549639 RepID=A0A839GQP7_9BACT|nr:insulinase family protein [Rufibacter quisquiliarum]MBA9076161.1 putative Zn-dependent peptidase [Rufibacter quisquiliarum]
MKKYISIFFLALSAAVGSVAQTKQTPPAAGPAPTIELGKVEQFTLSNGLKVYVVENHKLPTVAMTLVLDRDPVLEGEKVGLTGAAAYLMRTGTTTRSKDQLDEQIDFIGATLNTSATGFSASSLKKHLPKLMELSADVLLNPQFKQEELDKFKKQMASNLAASKDDPATMETNLQQALLYGKNHPYGEILTEKSIENIAVADVQQFYSSYFRPNIGYLAIVGDITAKDAKKLVKQYFGKWKKGDVKLAAYPAPAALTANQVAIVDRPNSVQSNISVTYAVDLKPGSPDAIAATLMNNILGGSFARLDANLREKRAYTYGSNSNLSTDRLSGRFVAYASVRNSVTDSSFAQIMYEMDRLRKEPVSADELKKVQNMMTGSFARSLENPLTVAMFAINTARYNLPKDYYANYLKNVAAVTPADIQRVAQQYLRPDKAYLLAVGNAREIADKLKPFNVNQPLAYYDAFGQKTEAPLMSLPAGVTVQSVLAAYVNALGGKANVEKIKDLTIKRTMTVPGAQLLVTQQQKGVDKSLVVTTYGQNEINRVIINGTKGAINTQGQVKELDGTEVQDQKLDNWLSFLSYDQLGVKLALNQMEKVEGRDAYKLELTLPSGKKSFHYFDKETGLKVREVATEQTSIGTANQTTDLKDYREVNGIKFPHQIDLHIGGQILSSKVTSVEVNKNLKDDLFKVK